MVMIQLKTLASHNLLHEHLLMKMWYEFMETDYIVLVLVNQILLLPGFDVQQKLQYLHKVIQHVQALVVIFCTDTLMQSEVVILFSFEKQRIVSNDLKIKRRNLWHTVSFFEPKTTENGKQHSSKSFNV